jgi:hypothetical protein
MPAVALFLLAPYRKEGAVHVPDLPTAFALGVFCTVVRRPLANLEGRIAISRAKLFRVGDYVQVGDYAGYVSDIGMFRTSLMFVEEGVLCTRQLENGDVWHQSVVTIPPPEQPRACIAHRCRRAGDA